MVLVKACSATVWLLALIASSTVAQNSTYVPEIHGPVIKLKLNWGFDYTPDCVKRQPLVQVNGMWPPPTLVVKAGEQVTLELVNELIAVAFTVHLHGFDQLGTPWADGTGMITTCPIIPDTGSSIQIFKAPPIPGTYVYHGHVAMAKAAGFTGLLIVEPNPDLGIAYPPTYTHDETRDLLLADSYHAPILPTLSGLLQQTFRWAGDPQSVLINGLGYFNCSENVIYECADYGNALCASGLTTSKVCAAGYPVYYDNLAHCDPMYCPLRWKVQVESGKTYMLRIANGGILSFLNFAIEGHDLTVVELDGHPIKPKTVTSLDLHTGQRAAVLLKADQTPGVYWIDAATQGRTNVRYGSALLEYDGFMAPDLEGTPGENDPNLLALRASHPNTTNTTYRIEQQRGFEALDTSTFPKKADKTFVFLNTQERFVEGVQDHTPSSDSSGLGIGDDLLEKPQCFCSSDPSAGYLKWAVNRRTFKNPKTPLLQELYYGLETRSEAELEKIGMYRIEKGKVYDVVLQNYPACNGGCETHPWHLHGHDFWHVGTFDGAYDPSVPYPDGGGGLYMRDTINLVGGSPQNTTAPEGQNCTTTLNPCGYTVIRFEANNPGAWFFHCHIDWHLVMGMGVAFYYKDLPLTAPPPDLSKTLMCGSVTSEVVIKQQARLKRPGAYGTRGSGSSTKGVTPPGGNSAAQGGSSSGGMSSGGSGGGMGETSNANGAGGSGKGSGKGGSKEGKGSKGRERKEE